MRKKIRAILKGTYESLQNRSFQCLRFELARSSKLRKYDSFYLISRLKHEAHLLEKATKNPYSKGRGDARFQEVQSLLSEVRSRKLGVENIELWAADILKTFQSWKSLEESMAMLGTPPKENHELAVTSVRFWKDEPVQEHKIIDCVRAAQLAPASCNRQTFKICLLKNSEHALLHNHGASNANMFKSAPYRVFIFVNLNNYPEKYSHFIDVGLFAQNFILQAKKEGLGTCCCYASEHLDGGQRFWRRKFDLTSEYYCAMSILVGIPDEVATKPPRIDVEKIIITRSV